MADLTANEIRSRIMAIDDFLFRGNTGQIKMLTSERDALAAEADQLAGALTNALVESGVGNYETLYGQLKRLRQVNLIAAISGRYLELHPTPNAEIDAVFAAYACSEPDTAEHIAALEQMSAIFGEVCVALPSEAPSSPPRRTLFSRVFNRG